MNRVVCVMMMGVWFVQIACFRELKLMLTNVEKTIWVRSQSV